jgi:hypothetical protein
VVEALMGAVILGFPERRGGGEFWDELSADALGDTQPVSFHYRTGLSLPVRRDDLNLRIGRCDPAELKALLIKVLGAGRDVR